MFFIYSVLYIVATIVLFMPEYLKRPKDIRAKWLSEKLGNLPRREHSLWIHAVSVGEVSASVPFLNAVRKKYPGMPLVFSTTTDTGQKVAREKAPADTDVIYLPYDIGFILKKAISRVNPLVFMVIETELWPNTFRMLAREGIPVILLNGRISGTSLKGYRRISFFMKKVLSYVQEFGMQSSLDAERLTAIGADKKRISVLGNFKFDMDMHRAVPSWIVSLMGSVVVAGSTHPGEEELILRAYQENLDRFPDIILVIAPRHPERFGDVEELLRRMNIPYVRRTGLTEAVRPSRVLLLDSIGELAFVYSRADIAIIGKSFTGFGGQNPLEPAYWGKPIICGPHMENFTVIDEFYEKGAAFEVDAASLGAKITELLESPDKAKIAGEKARKLYLNNAGAVDRAIRILENTLGDDRL